MQYAKEQRCRLLEDCDLKSTKLLREEFNVNETEFLRK